MGYRETKVRADGLAKWAMTYLPVLWVVILVSILCFAAKPTYIAPGIFLATLACFGLVVLCLLPSWVMDVAAALRPPRTKSEIAVRFAKQHGLPIINIKLADVDPSDLRGIPLDD